MLHAIHYELTGERTKENTAALMALFGERGEAPGTVAHYVYADGGGGIVIVEDLERLYEDALHYAPWMDFEARPVMPIDEAVPPIVAWMTS